MYIKQVVIVAPTAKNAVSKNHPKESYTQKQNNISPPSIEYCIYNQKTLSGSWILNF